MKKLPKERLEAFVRNRGWTKCTWTAAPGRINIIGEHIDYNNGWVLPMAIDKSIVCVAAANDTPSVCRFFAVDLREEFEYRIGTEKGRLGSWVDYIVGSLDLWQRNGLPISGVDLAFAGDIPPGAGLSSSAALEASTAHCLASLWNIDMSKRELVLHCQKVEHDYVGVQCGVMDQYASVFGKIGNAILLDCDKVDHEYVSLHLEDYSFVLCNSGVSHSLAESQYNVRRKTSERALVALKKEFGVKSWRDVGESQINKCVELDIGMQKRAHHIIGEISRVHKVVEALGEQKLNVLGELLYESHVDLSSKYEVSCKELDFLVDYTREKDYILGARMMGGGFGGCSINLVQDDYLDRFEGEIRGAYLEKFGIDPECYKVEGGEGVRVLEGG